ncbi:MAG: MBL fold metallo-hydrolase [Oscillospiraceae bacterium]|nr:MBL fold metallo-hydrolase [Oscillospiraceae bacterium]
MQKKITRVVGRIRTNCYIVYDDNTLDCIVIDPGDDAEGIWSIIQKERLTLKYIFMTHGHWDHITALPELQKLSEAPAVIHSGDAGMLKTQPDIYASDNQEFCVGELTFKWLHTPGHTPGSSCILCDQSLYTGDTLFRGECGRCDLEGGDFNAMLSSLKHLSGLPGDYAVFPGHGGSSTMELERANNQYIRKALSCT